MNKNIKIMKFIFTFYLTITTFLTYSQNLEIKGTVYDDFGNTLSEVNIYIEKTNEGTITNDNGEFLLKYKENDPIIKFSHLGYKIKELSGAELTNQNLKIHLRPYENVLEEITIPSKPISEIFKEILKSSKKKLKKSAILTTYNREILKTDSLYNFFADGICLYHLKGNRKKIKSNLYLKESRMILGDGLDSENFMKKGPIDYDIRKEVKKAFKENVMLKLIFKFEDNYDYTYKTITYNDSITHNIIEFEPKNGIIKKFSFSGYVVYDKESKLILEVFYKKSSNKIKDASGIKSKILSFSMIDFQEKINYRISNGKYILVYKKRYENFYVRNIFAKKYNKNFSFYSDLTVLDYKEGFYDFKNETEYKDKSILFNGNTGVSNFWENISILESNEEIKFKESLD